MQCFPGSEWTSVCTYTADLLTLGFKAAPPPFMTSHINANGSHRPRLTCMMDSITMAIGLPCCPGLHRYSIPKGAYCGKDHRASLPNTTRSGRLLTTSGCLLKTQQNVFVLHVLGLTINPVDLSIQLYRTLSEHIADQDTLFATCNM